MQTSLAHLLPDAAQRFGDKTAVVVGEEQISFRELDVQSSRLAHALQKLGIRQGARVSLIAPNSIPWVVAYYGVLKAGATINPLNMGFTAAEAAFAIHDCGSVAVVGSGDHIASLLGQVGLQGIQHFIAFGGGTAAPVLDFDTLIASASTQYAPCDAGPDALAAIAYTSGTTGHPKGVKREAATPEQAAAYIALIARVYGITPGANPPARALVAGPLYHASPNAYGRQALPNCELLVLQSKFDPEETLALIARHRLTHAVMVPTMFVRLLKLPPEVRARYDVSSLQWVTHTGAPCPVEVKQALMAWWGPVVYETYGGSEVGTATVSTPQDWLAHPGSVGVPTPGTRIAFYGEDGTPVAPGEVGEIYMRVPAYADFTYLHHEGKRASVERDGLISCGDVGYLKDDHLYLCDRRSDMVISAGTNIYPAEIEMALMQCPGVQDCAVFGIPDDEFGESLAAAVQVMPGEAGAALTADSVRAYLATRLAKYKLPRRVDFHAALPREDSGKIFKRRLRDPYWQAAGRKI